MRGAVGREAVSELLFGVALAACEGHRLLALFLPAGLLKDRRKIIF